MNLIEQLQKRKVAINKGGEFEDVKRVLNYAFPEDRDNLNHWWYEGKYYLAFEEDDKYWDYSNTLPNGMKAVDVKEFIKEIDYIEQTKDMLNAEGYEDFKAKYEAEKERADKYEAKLKELQPFERGTKGWVKFQDYNCWSDTKYEYIGMLGKFHFVCNLSLGCKRVYDFRTDNPHKKETVFASHTYDEFNESVKESVIVLLKGSINLSTGNIKPSRIETHYSHGTSYFDLTQIGDDLQAKFEDPNNDKYISLIK